MRITWLRVLRKYFHKNWGKFDGFHQTIVNFHAKWFELDVCDFERWIYYRFMFLSRKIIVVIICLAHETREKITNAENLCTEVNAENAHDRWQQSTKTRWDPFYQGSKASKVCVFALYIAHRELAPFNAPTVCHTHDTPQPTWNY